MANIIQLLIILSLSLFSVSHGLSIPNRHEVDTLSQVLRLIYNEGGTLGVLQRSQGMTDFGSTTLVAAALKASQGDKGIASGILNGLLGSCCKDSDSGATMAVDLMQAYDNIDPLKPDLVAFALAFAATDGTRNQKQAEEFLRRAELLHGNPPLPSQSPSQQTNWAELERRHDIRLLQETDDFVVVSKPSGMVCYHTSSNSTPTNTRKLTKDTSLETHLLNQGVALSTLNVEGRGIVHRLDRGTSGCMVLAKTNRMHAHLVAQFFLRTIQKSYKALVCPSSKLPVEGTIDLDVARQPAKSHYTVETEVGSFVTRIQVKTQQGRKHQVRLHCSRGLHAPILMDPLYGGQAVLSSTLKKLRPSLVKIRATNKLCLHADRLCIPKFNIDAQTPLPDWWCDLEEELASI